MLQPDRMIDRLKQARAIVAEVFEGTDLPQIQATLRQADQNLHWALWNLGEVESLRPDLPGSRTEADAPPAAKAGTPAHAPRHRHRPTR